MDGAFFQREMIELLERKGAGYAIKVPFFKWLGLLPLIRERQRWQALKEGMDASISRSPLPPGKKLSEWWSTESPCITKRKRIISSISLILTTAILSIPP